MPFRRIRAQIGERLRLARKAARVSLEEAGQEVERSKAAVHAWESGESDLSASQLAVLCERYGVTPNSIIYGDSTDARDVIARIAEGPRMRAVG